MFIPCFFNLIKASKLQCSVSINRGPDVIALLHATLTLYLGQLALTANVRQPALYFSHVGNFEGFTEGEVAVPENPPAGEVVTEVVKLVIRLKKGVYVKLRDSYTI